MSRAIQRLMKDYRRAEQLVGRSSNEPFADFANTSSFTTQTYAQQMAQLRREPELTQDEKKYLVAVERGDMATTRRYLDMASKTSSTLVNTDIPITPININCLDPLGRSALLIAIEYENIEMIELLLNYNVDTGEALLRAIDEEFVEAVELLLQHEDLKQQQQQQQQQLKNSIDEDNNKYPNNTTMNDKSNELFTFAQVELDREKSEQQQQSHDVSNKVTEQLNLSTSRSYTPDITPVILAAHRDNYEIVKILLERGEKVTEPHDVRCDCENCIVYNKEDSLRHSRSRINAYKALSSPCYISLSSRDPIMTAFDLNRELKRLSRIENEFKQEYEELAQQCQDYSASLLAETRSSKELEIILNYDSENPPVISETKEKMTLARLKLAIRYKQKKFVSHSHCQQLLASLWYEGLPGFRRRHSVIKLLITAIVGLLCPILSLAYLLMPSSSFGRIMRQPFIKFICHSVSYIFFLILLFVVSLRIDFGKLLSGIEEEANERRGPPPNPVELAIMFYVAGFIWAEIKQLYQEGLHQYMADTWNLLDWITNCLYVATIVLRVMAYIKVNREERDLHGKLVVVHGTHPSSGGLPSSPHHNLTADSVDISTGHNVRRRDWNAWDPTLISEGIFAAANIFSSLKLVYIFTINPHLGPLQISLGRMVHDILKFSVLIILVAFAFACGLNQLFWYYARMKKSECEHDSGLDEYCAKDIHKHFSNLFESLQTLFWGTFGLVDLQTFQIYKKHTFTMFIGLTMYGVYSSIMIIVLLNMLIAMMSNSYQYIANSTDTEWKFARAKLWTSYFEDGGTLPPPFNIIPSPKSIFYVCRYTYRRVFGCSKKQLRNRWQSIKKILVKINEREIKYQTVIRELVKRYIMKRQQKDQTEGVTEDDLNEIKQDVSAFRFELLEILSINGFKVQSLKKNPAARVGRKRGKMNLEKTINKNMFNMASVIRNANPLAPSDPIKTDLNEHHDSSLPTPISSRLVNPKQKLATQFKRALTIITQRNDQLNDLPSTSSSLPAQPQLPLSSQATSTEKLFDTTILTPLTEESIQTKGNLDNFGHMSSSRTMTPKPQSFIYNKSQTICSSTNEISTRNNNDSNSPSSVTILSMDSPIIRPNHPNSPSARLVKQSLQQIHASILQTMHQHNPLLPPTTSSSVTLSPTLTSSSTMGTGYYRLLREARAPMASPDPLSMTSEEGSHTPDLENL
ncbi:unnamed protein product [Rotaria sp. Silwood1]|nr:unnamed protein product [Rotaria sp. Silwood1]CAF0839134.1 unnamed protein product [Rotaria sp. Silwood1]CAF3369672.1 unnamed protein product [Rotaria sp. Silwood1]CAF3404318.1 unnamed protein product [Rotaria sp. Silwood1]CAF4616673.1 unnamed protein product [Rotaria sp. Silwood1]